MANYDIQLNTDFRGLEKGLLDVADGMGAMAQSVSNVSNYVSMVDSKVGSVTSEVNSLSKKIDNFMASIEGTTAVTNAKQSIMLANQELDKKYRYYDAVRKQTTGTLQAVDLSSIRPETLTKLAEDVVLKTPNYWLGRAYIALVSWINNNKELANRTLNDALRIDDENTSLLFFLIHMRLDRVNTALTWFNRYLQMQDPMKMDFKIVNIINSMISGIYGLDAKKLLLLNIHKWTNELESKAGIHEQNVNNYIDFINEKKKNIVVDNTGFFNLSGGATWDVIRENLRIARLNTELYEYFNKIFEQKENVIPKRIEQIDLMLDDLITNYDKDESVIRKEIIKNKIIVEENGNLEKANKRIEKEIKGIEGIRNLYEYLDDISLYPFKYDCLLTTRKYAIAQNKEAILEALRKEPDIKKDFNIKLKILDWEGTTKDGSNDKQLKASLFNYVDTTFHKDVIRYRYMTTKVILGIVLILIGLIGGVLWSPIIFIGAIIGAIICAFDCKNVYDSRMSVKKEINELKKNVNIILNSNIAEVIDLNRELDKGIEDRKKLIAFIDSLSIEQFILSTEDDTHRKVIIGE